MSIYDFVSNVLSKDSIFLNTFIDSLMSGVHGGDIRELSARSTIYSMFPKIKSKY